MPARLRLALFVTGLLALAAIAGVLLFAVGERTVPAARASPAPPARPASPRADFGVRDERGKPLRLADMRGKPVVVTFLYTTCQDTCPLTAQQIRIALDDLGHDVPVVAVSVDPANDTAAPRARVRAQAGPAGPHALGAGQRRELQRALARLRHPAADRRRRAHRLDGPARQARACSASASRRAS